VTAEDALLRLHQRQVQAVAARYTGRGVELDDLIQEGMLGLVEAIRSYDPGRGTSLNGWVIVCATSRIRQAIRHRRRQQRTAYFDPDEAATLADDVTDHADDGDFFDALVVVRNEMTTRDAPIFLAWLGTNTRGPLSPAAVARRYHTDIRRVLTIIGRGLRICRDRCGIDSDLSSVRVGKARLSLVS